MTLSTSNAEAGFVKWYSLLLVKIRENTHNGQIGNLQPLTQISLSLMMVQKSGRHGPTHSGNVIPSNALLDVQIAQCALVPIKRLKGTICQSIS